MIDRVETHDPYAALRHRDFRLFLINSVAATIGGEMQSVAVGWELYERTNSKLALAFVGLVQALPVLLMSLPAGHVADRYVDIHPAIFVIVLVLLSQFGFLWVLIAAPLSIVLRDLFRYVYGRLSDPPAPAGIAPGEKRVVAGTRRLTRTRREVAHG